MKKLLRDHSLLVSVVILGYLMFAFYTWAEWQYFQDNAKSHHEPAPIFWSSEHVHDWAYNAASNWQSELLFGIAILVLLHRLPGGRKDQT